ncbi:6,7-dimethyl-8-ribityllumazine synthase [Patescibacteria group bacterium]|nr:6,7-dimethyl-8-ribityllumazine synthase [Patescibacteria group bacterium]
MAKKNKIELIKKPKITVGIVKSNFNQKITDKMLYAVEAFLKANKIKYKILEVPGAFEIPLGLNKMIKSNKYKCLVAIGCLIKGETRHFDVIADAVTKKILDLEIENNISIGFGIITALNKKQAKKRTDLGVKATITAINTYSIMNAKK